MIKIIEHFVSGETKIMGYDHPPYSHNGCGAPDEIVNAVQTGFGFNVTDIDCRQIEWRDETIC